MDAPPRLLLVGGGHAMLPSILAARQWVDRGADVRLISDHRFLYYSGMVPEYLGGVYRADEVQIDLEALCVEAGIPFVEASATRLDPAARQLHTADGTHHVYDLIAFDVGAVNPEAPGKVVPTKPLHCVEVLARRVQAALDAPPEPFHLAIVGGGAAGVEVGLNLAHRFARYGRAEQLHLTIIEEAPTLLPGFPDGMQRYVARRLRRRGVALKLNARVVAIENRTLRLETHGKVEAETVLWATGAAGPPIFREAHLPCDADGFVRVHPTLQSVAEAHVFAAGDCASVSGLGDLRKIGVHAVKQGPVLRDNLDRALAALADGREPASEVFSRFKPYPAAPLILSTGTPEGAWTTGRFWLRGTPMLRLKHFVDRRWMRRYHPHWQQTGLTDLLAADAAS